MTVGDTLQQVAKEQKATPLETAVAQLYVEFFKLRQAGKHQEEYDAMGTLSNMLNRDRAHLREKHGVKP